MWTYTDAPLFSRVAITDYRGQTLADYYVLPTNPVSDYRTATTGIQPQHLVARKEFPHHLGLNDALTCP